MTEITTLYQAGNLQFRVRPATSDQTSVDEVVGRRAYLRKDFMIEPGERWLDLGANVGAFSCLAASMGAQVVGAYEPVPNNAALARRNLELNGFTVPVHESAVVADSVTAITLPIGLSNTRHGQWRHSLYKKTARRKLTVPVVRFGTLLAGVDGIKMDIEGAEIDILYELADWSGVQKLCFEYHFDVNNSIPLFREIVERLGRHFARLTYGKMPEGETYDFFPPARLVFCRR